jgi:hypothetical protein
LLNRVHSDPVAHSGNPLAGKWSSSCSPVDPRSFPGGALDRPGGDAGAIQRATPERQNAYLRAPSGSTTPKTAPVAPINIYPLADAPAVAAGGPACDIHMAEAVADAAPGAPGEPAVESTIAGGRVGKDGTYVWCIDKDGNRTGRVALAAKPHVPLQKNIDGLWKQRVGSIVNSGEALMKQVEPLGLPFGIVLTFVTEKDIQVYALPAGSFENEHVRAAHDAFVLAFRHAEMMKGERAKAERVRPPCNHACWRRPVEA